MESVTPPLTLDIGYTILTKVKRVWQHQPERYVSGIGKEAVFQTVDGGWYVAFEGSYEALYFGEVVPSFKVGDEIKIKFEKVKQCQA